MKKPWKSTGWMPYLTDQKRVEKISNFRVGWMMWWRAFLPLLISGGLFVFKVDIVLLIIFFLPVSFFLLDWAGKTVAGKKYNVVATSIKMYTIPVPLTTAFVSLSNIGAGIWWRMILFNILLFPLSFASSFLFSALPVAGIVSFLLFIFLQILILGWVTNRVISRLFKLSFVTTKIDRKVERKKTVRHNNLPMYSLMSIKCPFCKRKLKYSSDPTKLYTCRCGAYGEWEIEGKVLQFSKGNQSKTVNYNIMTVKSFWSLRKEHKGRSQNKR